MEGIDRSEFRASEPNRRARCVPPQRAAADLHGVYASQSTELENAVEPGKREERRNERKDCSNRRNERSHFGLLLLENET
jgi:hypothetical protein